MPSAPSQTHISYAPSQFNNPAVGASSWQANGYADLDQPYEGPVVSSLDRGRPALSQINNIDTASAHRHVYNDVTTGFANNSFAVGTSPMLRATIQPSTRIMPSLEHISKMSAGLSRNQQGFPHTMITSTTTTAPIQRLLPSMALIANRQNKFVNAANAEPQPAVGFSEKTIYQPSFSSSTQRTYQAIDRPQLEPSIIQTSAESLSSNMPSMHGKQHRQLPVVTPHGPRPIVNNPRSFSKVSALSDDRRSLDETHSYANDLLAGGSKRAADDENDLTRARLQGHIGQKVFGGEPNARNLSQLTAAPIPLAKQVHMKQELPGSRDRGYVNFDRKSHRQLPIITRQGVLRLRDTKPSEDLGLISAAMKRAAHDQHQTRPILMQLADENAYMDEEAQSDNVDIEEENDRSESSVGNDELSASAGKVTDSSHDENRTFEFDDDSPSKLGKGMSVQEDFAVNSDMCVDEDEVSETDSYYNDPSQIEEAIDEEGEYFSALATVPEEDSKLSDRENAQECEDNLNSNQHSAQDDRFHDLGLRCDGNIAGYEQDENKVGRQEVEYLSSNSNDLVQSNMGKKLPTIIENGFEVQVLEYLASKTGIRRNELFSVDEEPSSYNDDADSRTSTNLENGIEEINILAGQKDHANSEPMINDSEQPANGDVEPGIKENFKDISDTYDTAPQSNNASVNGLQLVDSIRQLRNDESFDAYQATNNDNNMTICRETDDEELDDEQIIISPSNINKTSQEQEEYDEQYRDVNNLEDLDRRATNHVHAIDGHSKSMLNDIHQQRAIVDYYDGGEYMAPEEQDTSKIDNLNFMSDEKLMKQRHADGIRNLDQDGLVHSDRVNDGQLGYENQDLYHMNNLDQPDLKDTSFNYSNHLETGQQSPLLDILQHDKQLLDIQESHQQGDSLDQEHRDGLDMQAEETERGQSLPDELSETDLPRARIRWITAVNKIVNRSNEVSTILYLILQTLVVVLQCIFSSCKCMSSNLFTPNFSCCRNSSTGRNSFMVIYH